MRKQKIDTSLFWAEALGKNPGQKEEKRIAGIAVRANTEYEQFTKKLEREYPDIITEISPGNGQGE